MKLGLWFASGLFAFSASVSAQSYKGHAEVDVFIDEMVKEHKFEDRKSVV